MQARHQEDSRVPSRQRLGVAVVGRGGSDDEIATLIQRTAEQYEQYLALSRLTELTGPTTDEPAVADEPRDMNRPVGLTVSAPRD